MILLYSINFWESTMVCKIFNSNICGYILCYFSIESVSSQPSRLDFQFKRREFRPPFEVRLKLGQGSKPTFFTTRKLLRVV